MCKIYRILYVMIPVKKWKSLLIRRHFERCPDCAGESDLRSDVVRLFFKPDWLEETSSVWPAVRRRIVSEENEFEKIRSKSFPSSLRLPRWAFAAAGATLFVLGTIGFFLLRHHDLKILGPESLLPKNPAVSIPRVQVISVELAGKRAKTYIFQTPTATFIWIAPSKDIGG